MTTVIEKIVVVVPDHISVRDAVRETSGVAMTYDCPVILSYKGCRVRVQSNNTDAAVEAIRTQLDTRI